MYNVTVWYLYIRCISIVPVSCDSTVKCRNTMGEGEDDFGQLNGQLAALGLALKQVRERFEPEPVLCVKESHQLGQCIHTGSYL